ncbi:MAG: hypothetical protein ACRC7O_06310 [Fimbriiglobus sp.]
MAGPFTILVTIVVEKVRPVVTLIDFGSREQALAAAKNVNDGSYSNGAYYVRSAVPLFADAPEPDHPSPGAGVNSASDPNRGKKPVPAGGHDMAALRRTVAECGPAFSLVELTHGDGHKAWPSARDLAVRLISAGMIERAGAGWRVTEKYTEGTE